MKGDGNILELGKRINGIYKRRIVTVWTEEWFYGPITFRVNVSGNNIKVHINDAPKINYDDLTDPFLTGSVGAFAISEGWIEGMIWDEFQVTLGFIDIGLRVYDGTSAITIACEPQGTLTSPLRISKNGQTYGIALVDPSDPMASKIRIQTSSGIKALRKF